MSTVYLDPAQLAARWGNKPNVKTLANWRSLGKGPRWVKNGKHIMYSLDLIQKYEAENGYSKIADYGKKTA